MRSSTRVKGVSAAPFALKCTVVVTSFIRTLQLAGILISVQ